MKPLFAFDPGTHSVGWAVFTEHTDGRHVLAACGAMLLPPADGDGREALAARRRKMQRRARHRRRARMTTLRRALEGHGLLPRPGLERDALFAADPYVLRHRGLREPLGLGEIARALLHLAGRRGADEPSGAGDGPEILPIDRLWPRHRGRIRERRPVRARAGLDDIAPLLPGRQAVAAEFDALWAFQRSFHSKLENDSVRMELRAIAFDESVQAPVSIATPRPAPAGPQRAIGRLLARLVARFGRPQSIAWETSRAGDRRVLADRRLSAVRSRRADRRLAIWRRMAAANGGLVACPYSGRPIAAADIQSRRVEIDHVVPLSRGGRRTPANEVLCMADANRMKAAMMPREAADCGRIVLSAVNAINLPTLAAADAPRNHGFALRRPRDMARIGSRLASIFARGRPRSVHAVAPSEAAAAAQRLGYPNGRSKDRRDLRHHAVDAVAIAAAAFRQIGPPDLDTILTMAALSVQNRRGPHGRMHEETIYSVRPGDGGAPDIASRKLVTALGRSEVQAIVDPFLRRRIAEWQADAKAGAGWRRRLADFSRSSGIRRVRLMKVASHAIVLPGTGNRRSRCAVLARTNHAIDIVAMPDGAWRAFGISLHERLRKAWRPLWEVQRLGGKLVMRLRRGDCVELDGGNTLLRVHRLAPSNGYLWLAGIAEGGNLAARHADPADPFRFAFLSARALRDRGARAVAFTAEGGLLYRPTNIAGQAPMPGSAEADPGAPEPGGPTATDSVCRRPPEARPSPRRRQLSVTRKMRTW